MRDTVLYKFDFLHRMYWGKVMGLLLIHGGALSAAFFFSWSMLVMAFATWFLIGPVGTCAGFHRLLTHRSFQTSKLVEYSLAICGALAFQRPLQWARTHLAHHQDTDKVGKDPHTPKEGRFWSFVGWIIIKRPNRHDDEALNGGFPKSAIERLERSPFYVLLNRFYWLLTVTLGIALYLWGGYPAVAWGICVPFVVAWNSIWYLNMAGHSRKTPRLDIKNFAHDSKIAGWLTTGEWHGKHHEYPRSARQGFKWYQFDLPWYLIRAGQMLGLVWGVNLPR